MQRPLRDKSIACDGDAVAANTTPCAVVECRELLNGARIEVRPARTSSETEIDFNADRTPVLDV